MQAEPMDRTPLLGNGTGTIHRRSFSHRCATFFLAEDEPSWSTSYRYFLFGSWLNIMLVFVPLSVVSHHLNWDAALRFSFSFLAIVPLAKVCVTADEACLGSYIPSVTR
jgi:Ca2+:H+ antiporter